MPGLLGFIHKNSIKETNNENIIEKMIDSIMHESFYKVDKYINSSFEIARVHLDIFNPEKQPIFNSDGSLCIFFDGKIYNYDEDMKKLEYGGYRFKYKNDAEYCLYSFEKYGKEFVKKLEGSFVFVILDLKKEKVFIFNDRYGLRPLYYFFKETFVFASEVKAILKYPQFKKKLKYESVIDWFNFSTILGDRTFFEDIYLLPPASIMVYDGKELSIDQYWDYNYEPDYGKSEDEFIEELISTMKNAVEIRMEKDYNYGLSLSGGLDSRTILAAMDIDKRNEVIPFTFGPEDCDEAKIAKKVSEKVGLNIDTLDITPEMIIENAQNMVYYSDGLVYMGYSYVIPLFKIMKDKMDVVFDGLALDLTLGGSYLGSLRDKKMINNEINVDILKLLVEITTLFKDHEMDELLIEGYNGYKSIGRFKKEFNRINEKDKANHFDIFLLKNRVRRSVLMSHVLIRTIMENSVPTYDNNLMELISKIPPESRFYHRLYRKFLIKLSPELSKIHYNSTMVRADYPLILWALGSYYRLKKEGLKMRVNKLFPGKIFLPNKRVYLNFSQWFRVNENWKNYFKELLLTEKTVSKKYLNQKYIQNLICEHEKGEEDNALKILHIASFEIFLRLFFGEGT
jgi:Asparagine synthase (glutamine-hydrolyzing)